MVFSDKIQGFFGDEVAAVLHGAERLEAWRLTYKDDEASGRLGNYRTTGQVDPLPDGALETLQGVLADDGLYEFLLIARVPFRPMHAFVFHKGEDEVVLLVDLQRRKLGWLRGEERGACDMKSRSDGFASLRALIDQASGLQEEGS